MACWHGSGNFKMKFNISEKVKLPIHVQNNDLLRCLCIKRPTIFNQNFGEKRHGSMDIETLKLEIIFSSRHTFSLTWLLARILFASPCETKVESDLRLKPCQHLFGCFLILLKNHDETGELRETPEQKTRASRSFAALDLLF